MHCCIRLISKFHITILSHVGVLLRTILRNEMGKFFYLLSAKILRSIRPAFQVDTGST